MFWPHHPFFFFKAAHAAVMCLVCLLTWSLFDLLISVLSAEQLMLQYRTEMKWNSCAGEIPSSLQLMPPSHTAISLLTFPELLTAFKDCNLYKLYTKFQRLCWWRPQNKNELCIPVYHQVIKEQHNYRLQGEGDKLCWWRLWDLVESSGKKK